MTAYVTSRRTVKRSDGDYGSDEWSVEIPIPVPPDANYEQRMQLAADAFAECGAVLTEQGAPLSEDAEVIQHPSMGNVPAQPAAAAPAAPAPAAPAAAPAMTAEQVAGHMGGAVVVPDNPAQYTGSVKEWSAARVEYLYRNDGGLDGIKKEFWDNRSDKRNPKAPDFKHKENGDWAVWLNNLPADMQQALAV